MCDHYIVEKLYYAKKCAHKFCEKCGIKCKNNTCKVCETKDKIEIISLKAIDFDEASSSESSNENSD